MYTFLLFLLAFFLTDREFEGLKNKDHRIFEKVYNRYKKIVYSYLCYKIGDSIKAGDLVNDTFFEVYKYIHTLNDAGVLKSWIMKVARQSLYRYIKKDKREKAKVESLIFSNPSGYNESSNPEISFLKGEKAMLFDEALHSLKIKNSKHHSILKLKYIEEKSQKEIAEILGRSEGAVEGLLSRARENLKSEVGRLNKKNLYFEGGLHG